MEQPKPRIKIRKRSLDRQNKKLRIYKNKISEDLMKKRTRIIAKLKKTKMAWYNILKWPASLVDDISQWRTVRRALKETDVIERFKQFKYPLRIDRIGRVYTVINIPEELLDLDKKDMVWPWLLEQLKELDALLMEVMLSDLLYPRVDRIPGTTSYLVILTPSNESFSFFKFIGWLFKVSIYVGVFYLSNRLCLKYSGSSIVDNIISLF